MFFYICYSLCFRTLKASINFHHGAKCTIISILKSFSMCGLHSVLVGQTGSLNSLHFQLQITQIFLCSCLPASLPARAGEGVAVCDHRRRRGCCSLRLGVGVLWFWLCLLKSSSSLVGMRHWLFFSLVSSSVLPVHSQLYNCFLGTRRVSLAAEQPVSQAVLSQ